MKQSLTWLMAVAISLALVTTASAENAVRSGKVVRIKGDARYSTSKKVWEPLKVGAILKSGSVIQTAKDSFVDIVINEDQSAGSFKLQAPKSSGAPSSAGAGAGAGGSSAPTPDQDVVRVLEDSYLVVDSLTAKNTGAGNVTETLLDLKKGSIFGSVKKQAAASRFEVKIPNGVAGIRGTTFKIDASGTVSCMSGSVVAAFTSSSGNVETKAVGSGSQLNCNTGETSPIAESDMGAYSSTGSQISGYSQEPKQKDKPEKDHGEHNHVSHHNPK